ncbi:SDR family NAD(P)-dependent oxidoreductase [Streptomyces sp. NPDC052396]
MDGNRFAGKVVVTGGGSGIGVATAYRFGREGATVIVMDGPAP